MGSLRPESSTANSGAAGHRLSIAYRPITELRLDPQNARTHTRRQIEQIARSIEAFGFNVPILIDRQDRIVAGHGRVLACLRAGITQVPTICLEYLREAQIRAFMIADNRLTENSTWDERLLAEQLKALCEVELDFSLEATGFEMGEIDMMIEGLEPADAGAEDPAATLPGTADVVQVTRPGDLWLLGKHRVLCGDALQEDSYTVLMAGRRAAAVFFDPSCCEKTPADFTNSISQLILHLVRNSAEGSLHYICMEWQRTGELLAAAVPVYTEWKDLCVWVKDAGGRGSLYRSQHELVFVFKSGTGKHRNHGQLGRHRRRRTNVWQYPRVTTPSRARREGSLAALHPAIKPVELVADAILDSTARREIILDSFLGSGTTVIAAERTGRICCGIELDPAYVDATVRRWQVFASKNAVDAVSGRSFNEVEEELKHEQGR